MALSAYPLQSIKVKGSGWRLTLIHVGQRNINSLATITINSLSFVETTVYPFTYLSWISIESQPHSLHKLRTMLYIYIYNFSYIWLVNWWMYHASNAFPLSCDFDEKSFGCFTSSYSWMWSTIARTCNPTLKRNYEADRDVIGCQDIEEIISICPRISVINLADFKTESN